jgi:hypothetical protein
MSLTSDDRQWVKDMIAAAAVETLNKSRDFAREKISSHASACPNLQRLKWMLFGLGIGLGASAPSIVKGVASIFTAV